MISSLHSKRGILAVAGLVSVAAITSLGFLFFNDEKVVKLNVPYFKQQYANSCEAASLRMALAYYGIQTNDIEIVKKFGYNPRYLDQSKNEWDDPQEMYVGYVDRPNGGGYGVYRMPVARAVEEFGRKTAYTTVITPEFLAQEIQFGNPVIVWGYTNLYGSPYTWNTPNGGTATAIKGEHARLVVGYYGSLLNPTGFYLHDPINGKQYEYWSAEKLMSHMNAVPGITNQAVVVR